MVELILVVLLMTDGTFRHIRFPDAFANGVSFVCCLCWLVTGCCPSSMLGYEYDSYSENLGSQGRGQVAQGGIHLEHWLWTIVNPFGCPMPFPICSQNPWLTSQVNHGTTQRNKVQFPGEGVEPPCMAKLQGLEFNHLWV